LGAVNGKGAQMKQRRWTFISPKAPTFRPRGAGSGRHRRRYGCQQYREKLASDVDVAQIESAANSAKDAGIDGVPTFILGGVAAITGAQSPEVIANAIEQIATNRDKFMAEQRAAAR
jgi:hypothetical protein